MVKKLKFYLKNLLHILFKYVFFRGDRVTLKVRSGPAKGIKLSIDVRDNLQYYFGHYDSWFLDKIDFKDFLKEGSIAWDCGSYIGYYTGIFRKIVGERGKVHTFEASPLNFQIVKKLPEINHWENVYCHNLAIGKENSILKFTNNVGGSNGPIEYSKQFNPGKHYDVVDVSCYGTDQLVRELKIDLPDFIKFDLESAEEFALFNGDNVFKNKRPVILLESHTKRTLELVVEFGKKYNYVLYNLNQQKNKDLFEYSPKKDLDRKVFWVMFLCVPAERLN